MMFRDGKIAAVRSRSRPIAGSNPLLARATLAARDVKRLSRRKRDAAARARRIIASHQRSRRALTDGDTTMLIDDAGRSRTYRAPEPPQPPPPPEPKHASDEELRQKAKDNHRVGDRSGRDDYDARMDRFAREMEPLDLESRGRLLKFILEDDSSAALSGSWLTVDRLNSRAEGGHITSQQQTAVAQSVVALYESDPQAGVELLDDLVLYADASGDTAGMVKSVNDFVALLPSEEGQRFKLDYAQSLLERGIDYEQNQLISTAGPVAVQLLSESSEGRKQLADFYIGLDESDSNTLREMLARDGEVEHGAWTGDGEYTGPADPLSLLIKAVAEQPGEGQTKYDNVGGTSFVSGTQGHTEYDDAAIDLVRWADKNHDRFFQGDEARKQRGDAMADLFMNHDTAILNALTDPRFGQEEPGSSNHTPLATGDAMALGNLFRLTTLNPDVAGWKSNAIQSDVMRYAAVMANDADGDDPNGVSTVGRVGMLFIGLQDGVKQGYQALEDDRAAQEQFVGFFTDLVIDSASEGVTKAGPQGLLAEITGPGVDYATDAGKEFAKQKVTDFLFGEFDTADQDKVQSDINQLVGAYVQSRPGDQEIDIGNFMIGMGEAVDDKRG
jgi:hypothetical protein